MSRLPSKLNLKSLLFSTGSIRCVGEARKFELSFFCLESVKFERQKKIESARSLRVIIVEKINGKIIEFD